MDSRVAAWLRHPETLKVALHAMLSGVMAWLSFALWLPGDTFANPSFAAFARLASEEEWSGMFLVAAMIGLSGLLSRRRWVRLLSIAGLSTAHGSVAYCFYLSSVIVQGLTISTGVGVYSLIAAMGYLLLWVRAFEH